MSDRKTGATDDQIEAAVIRLHGLVDEHVPIICGFLAKGSADGA